MPDATTLREQLAGIPTGPGVYIYRDAADRVLYVGKAKSLRRRVHSYFQAPLRPDESERPGARMRARSGLHPKIAEMVERIARIEVFVTSSESEALILEANLVKPHRPPFNVRLRDDKCYPYIADQPRRGATRGSTSRASATGATGRYFGPFSNAYKVRDTLSLINRSSPAAPARGPSRAAARACRASTTTSSAAGALRGLHLGGGLPGPDRPDHRVPLGPLPRARAGAPGRDGRGRGGPGVRAGGRDPQPAGGGART